MPTELKRLEKKWVIAEAIPQNIDQELINYSPLLRQLLYNRGVKTSWEAEAYLAGVSPTNQDPFQMSGMDEAVGILHEAISNKHKIAVYGDYDVDGITSSAILYEFFQAFGIEARVYIPDRFDEGYGLNLEAVEQLSSEGMQLIITVDCGISSVVEVARAKELGMKVIISDHHQVPEQLPNADAIINPHRPGDDYPFKELAGVGIAWKLVVAYLQRYPIPNVDPYQWIDLVAIGTVADVAELTGENRCLVKRGLALMQTKPRQSLMSLCQVSRIKIQNINAGDIGFGIGPRLNAAGRLEHANIAYQLLISKDLYEAARYAQELDNINNKRKNLVDESRNIALNEALAADKDQLALFVANQDFHRGLVGLIAQRVVESVYRPTVIGVIDGDTIVCSARSIEEFNLIEGLRYCDGLLEKYGGHPLAGGLTVKTELADAFIERLNDYAKEVLFGLELLPTLKIDKEILLDHLCSEQIPGILHAVDKLEPTGNKNPDALFCSRHCQVLGLRQLKDGKHLKFIVRDGGVQFEAVAWNMGHLYSGMPDYVDIAYSIEINEYMGNLTVQFNVKDIKKSTAKQA